MSHPGPQSLPSQWLTSSHKATPPHSAKLSNTGAYRGHAYSDHPNGEEQADLGRSPQRTTTEVFGGDEQTDLQDRRHSHDTALEIYWIIKAGSCHRMELLCYR